MFAKKMKDDNAGQNYIKKIFINKIHDEILNDVKDLEQLFHFYDINLLFLVSMHKNEMIYDESFFANRFEIVEGDFDNLTNKIQNKIAIMKSNIKIFEKYASQEDLLTDLDTKLQNFSTINRMQMLMKVNLTDDLMKILEELKIRKISFKDIGYNDENFTTLEMLINGANDGI